VAEFKHFYRQQKDKLFSYLVRMSGDWDVAKDLMQESFTRYLSRYGQETHNRALLFAIGRNAFLDYVRKSSRNVSMSTEPCDDDIDQEKAHLIREDYRRVLGALRNLGEKDRDILSLVISSGLSYAEIASLTGISVANVKVRVHRARLKIRKILRQEHK
jgi:RNA polymerase sigma-70 factor (ECF subfamily)